MIVLDCCDNNKNTQRHAGRYLLTLVSTSDDSSVTEYPDFNIKKKNVTMWNSIVDQLIKTLTESS